MSGSGSVDLYWLPLGAGGHSVRVNGRVYEALVAWRDRRARQDLYHAALEVTVPAGRYVIEMTPVRRGASAGREVVVTGPVGVRWAVRMRWLRYEICRWRGGVIPDVAEAVGGPRRVIDDPRASAGLLGLVPQVPAHVWGRDTLGVGDMWNSNSVVSWLLARSGADPGAVVAPAGGRAPGWRAGIVAAGVGRVS